MYSQVTYFRQKNLAVATLLATLITAHAESGPPLAAEEPASVGSVLRSQFQRVAGDQSGQAVVYPDSSSSWFDHSVGSPTVIFDGETYRMWFVGMSRSDDPGIPYGFAERIGLATSTDGVRWQLANQARPVLDFGAAGEFDDAGLAHPFVLQVGDRYMMWYGGIDGRTGKDVGVDPAHVRVEQIGLATSLDGVHWQRANHGKPVMTIGPRGSIDSIQATGCHVIRRGDQFVMWYGAYNGTHTIGIATSRDGIDWNKGNGGAPLSGLAGPKQLGPSVYFDGHDYLMFYNTIQPTPNGGTIWTLFAATSSDGIRWKPALGGERVLGAAPEGNFGSADGRKGNNHCVHPTKLVVLKNRIRLWYGAEGNNPAAGKTYAPSAIGLMEATRPRP
jgi:hypothetical protein